MRAGAPLVHCITNYVAMAPAANTLLAAGASPAMIHAVEEAGEFAAVSSALTVNIGTLSTPWLVGMRVAAAAARGAGVPWVLDPVAHVATSFRRAAVTDLLALRPSVVRGNASEIIALAGVPAGGRGVDSGDSVDDAHEAALAVARRHGCVVAATGPEDLVTDGTRVARVSGGSPLMAQVTAVGCSLTALVGAFAATTEDPWEATVGALAMFGVAGRRAGQGAPGPGTFAVRLLDELSAVRPEDLASEGLVRTVAAG
ncbi:MAG: hydroxyethylthiazole kinase [Kineosporiaceae bacterium]